MQEDRTVYRKLVNNWKLNNYLVVSCVKNKEPYDYIVITPTNILLIQVKRSKKALSPNFISSYYDEDIKTLRELTLPDNCIRYLYFWIDRHGLQKYKILPDRLELV